MRVAVAGVVLLHQHPLAVQAEAVLVEILMLMQGLQQVILVAAGVGQVLALALVLLAVLASSSSPTSAHSNSAVV
jgi:hypothetical protein